MVGGWSNLGSLDFDLLRELKEEPDNNECPEVDDAIVA